MPCDGWDIHGGEIAAVNSPTFDPNPCPPKPLNPPTAEPLNLEPR